MNSIWKQRETIHMAARFLVLVVAAIIILGGCLSQLPSGSILGSGRMATQTYDFSRFDSVEISDTFQADLTAGDGYAVEGTVDDNLVEYLEVEQHGGTVKIGLKPFTAVGNAHLRARITLPTLGGLNVSGASRAGVKGFRSDKNMRIKVSGASELRGDMETGDLAADVSGGSTLQLKGRGGAVRATASGASTLDLHDFAAGDADGDASGASRIDLDTAGTLNARASGASTVRYMGHPTLGRVDESGASTVGRR